MYIMANKGIMVFRACVESSGPYNLNDLPEEDHYVAPRINYMGEYWIPINMPRDTNSEYM